MCSVYVFHVRHTGSVASKMYFISHSCSFYIHEYCNSNGNYDYYDFQHKKLIYTR